MPAAPIEFWFEFSSPYAYFAALRIDALAARHGRTALWRPFLLGAVFQRTGMGPLTGQALRGDYARRDWDRLARLERAPFRLPDGFPLKTTAPARMTYAVQAEDPALSARFGRALFEAAYGEGADISDPDVAAAVGAGLGLERNALLRAAADDRWRAELRARTDEAIAKGVFGSPFVIVDGEGFWGADRLPMVELWLQRGGW